MKQKCNVQYSSMSIGDYGGFNWKEKQSGAKSWRRDKITLDMN